MTETMIANGNFFIFNRNQLEALFIKTYEGSVFFCSTPVKAASNCSWFSNRTTMFLALNVQRVFDA